MERKAPEARLIPTGGPEGSQGPSGRAERSRRIWRSLRGKMMSGSHSLRRFSVRGLCAHPRLPSTREIATLARA